MGLKDPAPARPGTSVRRELHKDQVALRITALLCQAVRRSEDIDLMIEGRGINLAARRQFDLCQVRAVFESILPDGSAVARVDDISPSPPPAAFPPRSR